MIHTILTYIPIIYVLLAFLGQLLHILTRLKVLIDNKIKFSFKTWIFQNLINSVYSLVAMVVLLIVFHNEGQLNASLAFMIGYTTDNLIKRLIETSANSANISVQPETETVTETVKNN